MTALSVLGRVAASAVALALLAACAATDPAAVSARTGANPAYFAYECPAIELRRAGASVRTLSDDFEVTCGSEPSRLEDQYDSLREAAALNGCLAAAADLAQMGPNGKPALVAAMQLPGGPMPYEGESLAACAPAEREAWCEAPWARSVDIETGRTIYDPCREPRYISR